MDILKATPELLAEYMNFLLTFTRKPGEAIGLKTATTEVAEPAVSGKLVLFSLLSVGAAVVIVQVGAAIGMAEDSSLMVKVAGGLDEKVLPVAVLVAIMALSSIAHVFLRVGALLAVVLGQEQKPFRGSITGSVNAALGFAAWSIPLMTAAIVSLRIAAANQETLNPIVIAIVGVSFGLAFWYYFIAAFAGAHRITAFHAGSLFTLTFVLVFFLGKLF